MFLEKVEWRAVRWRPGLSRAAWPRTLSATLCGATYALDFRHLTMRSADGLIRDLRRL